MWAFSQADLFFGVSAANVGAVKATARPNATIKETLRRSGAEAKKRCDKMRTLELRFYRGGLNATEQIAGSKKQIAH